MADSNILPGPRSWPNMPPEWFRFFRELQGAAEAPFPDIPDTSDFLPNTVTVTGTDSVQSIGRLQDGFTNVALVGDLPEPGVNRYYGTGPDGTKSYYDVYGVTFEAVSKNLKSWGATFAYSSGILQTITYTDTVETVVKTFGYTVDQLTSLTLSGDTPAGILLTKALSYTGDELTAVSYS